MNEDQRFVSPRPRDDDAGLDNTLRPQRLVDFPGQGRLKETLSIYVTAAKDRGEALDHVLLYGPPGLGKTTLAGIIANELGVGIRVTSGPAVERPGDLAAILTNMEPRDVLFIDEIHRLSRTVEEILYVAMEDFALDWMVGKGPSARSLRLELPPFTLIGATTRAGALTSPLRDRFGVVSRLEFYTTEELYQVALRSARILGLTVEPGAAEEIARRSRGTPRIANRLLKRLRDIAQVMHDGVVTLPVAEAGLRLMEVDSLGLDKTDHRMLRAIIERYDGGPVGLDTLAAAIGEEAETIEDVLEPFLLQVGFLQRTPRGRVATRLAYAHLQLPAPDRGEDGNGGQARLF